MDEQNGSEGKSAKAWSSQLISHLVDDPSRAPEDALVMFGVLGPSNREGFQRLYLTLELNEYVDFALDDVLHTQSYKSLTNNLGGVLVWIRKTAEIIRCSVRATAGKAQPQEKTIQLESWRRQATFLQGIIISGHAKISATPPDAGLGYMTALTVVPTVAVLPTYWQDCTYLPGCTFGDDCGSFSVTCPGCVG